MIGLDTVAASLAGGHPLPGVLYGIGAGPGDPGLVTVRGAALLRSLDVVAVPRSARGGGVAAAALAPWVEPERRLELVSDMPGETAAAARGWEARVDPLLRALDAGARVGFACEGDPSLYSTFAFVCAAVCARRPCTRVYVVPGVTAMAAAAAAVGEPLVQGAQRLAVLPAARCADSDIERALDTADVVVLLKVGAAIDRVRRLREGPARGWSVQYARRVGLDGEELMPGLEGLADPGDYMALAVLRRPADDAGGRAVAELRGSVAGPATGGIPPPDGCGP